MNHSLTRRTFLLAAAAIPMVNACTTWAPPSNERVARARFVQLEHELNGRLGVFALDTANGAWLGHRADERFPLCSTAKLMIAAAILKQDAQLLERRIQYAQRDLVTYSPLTGKSLKQGMTIAELCAAMLQYSDNTAANLLMKKLGGPAAVTAFARSIGDHKFRLDRFETDLNTAIPGDLRDTSTPATMGRSIQRLMFEGALAPQQSERLQNWLRGNTTGAARIRAGIPVEWAIGEKTGTGDYGTANDVGVLWPPHRKPIVIAIYTTQRAKDAAIREDIIAAAAGIVVDWAS